MREREKWTKETKEYSTFGRHVVTDVWGVDFDLLNDAFWLERRMVDAAKECGATVLSVQSKEFDPHGVTVFLVLSESHMSIHTYPEKGFAALDCYTCGHTVDPMVAIEHMLDVLKPKQAFSKILVRGNGLIR